MSPLFRLPQKALALTVVADPIRAVGRVQQEGGVRTWCWLWKGAATWKTCVLFSPHTLPCSWTAPTWRNSGCRKVCLGDAWGRAGMVTSPHPAPPQVLCKSRMALDPIFHAGHCEVYGAVGKECPWDAGTMGYFVFHE